MPDTTLYLLLGLAVTFLILGALILSMALRARSVQRDLRLLEELKDEG
jgi:cell division protein FtsL